MENKRYQSLALIFAGTCWGAVLLRTMFGIDLEDEAYWVATYVQLWQGGVPLMSIWDGHTGFFLMMPFFALYHAVVPSLDGIVLFSRIVSVLLFTGMALALAWVVHRGMQCQGKQVPVSWLILAMMPVVCWSNNILHINYNTGAAWMLTLLCAWYHFDFRDTRGFFLIAGILAGMACIFYPTMLILVVLLGAAAALRNWRHSDMRGDMRAWPYYFLGNLLVGGLFLLWIFTQGSLQEFTVAMQHVLHGPHEAYRGPLNAHFFYQTYIASIGHFFVRKSYLALLLLYLAGLYYCTRRMTAENSRIWLPRLFVAYVCLSAWINRNGYGYAILSFLLAYFLWMYVIGERPWRKNWIFYIVGCLFIGMYSLTSDNKNVLLGLSASTVIFAAGVSISLFHYWQEHSGRWKQVLMILLMSAFAGLAHLYLFVYGDVSIPKCLQGGHMTQGVYQGIYTSQQRQEYLMGMEQIVAEEVQPGDRVSVITLEPSIYLMSEGQIFAPWTFDAQYLFKGFYSDKPMTDYYRAYHALPDVIFATNRMEKSRDILSNNAFTIHDLLDTHYVLVRKAVIAGKEIYVWKKVG